jgi:hypothetical protein
VEHRPEVNAAGARFLLAEHLRTLTAEPWRNGGGVTRTLATGGDAQGSAGWHWRLSVAEIERDGAYSRFDGVDRWQAIIGGRELLLRGARGTRRLASAGEVFAFAGEDDVHAHLPAGPVRMWNLMLRRGVAVGELVRRELAAGEVLELPALAGDSHCWLFVLAGALAVTGPGGSLDTGEVLARAAPAPAVALQAMRDGTCVLVTHCASAGAGPSTIAPSAQRAV